jgi:hypothetical protein
MKKKQTNAQIIIERMPGETEQQFAAFLAYCLMLKRNVRDLVKTWSKLGQELEQQNSGIRLGKPVSKTTALSWSAKFHWQERAKKWTEERKKISALEFQQIVDERGISVARLFHRIKTYLLPQITANRVLTVDDFKKAWEMIRLESGLSTGKQDVNVINPAEQNLDIDEPTQKALQVWRKEHDARRKSGNNKKS